MVDTGEWSGHRWVRGNTESNVGTGGEPGGHDASILNHWPNVVSGGSECYIRFEIVWPSNPSSLFEK